MKYIELPEERFAKMEADLSRLTELFILKGEESFGWIESEKARNILGVCKKTWQTYRNKKLFPFSQIGKKIYVKKSDLEQFLSKHSIK